MAYVQAQYAAHNRLMSEGVDCLEMVIKDVRKTLMNRPLTVDEICHVVKSLELMADGFTTQAKTRALLEVAEKYELKDLQ